MSTCIPGGWVSNFWPDVDIDMPQHPVHSVQMTFTVHAINSHAPILAGTWIIRTSGDLQTLQICKFGSVTRQGLDKYFQPVLGSSLPLLNYQLTCSLNRINKLSHICRKMWEGIVEMLETGDLTYGLSLGLVISRMLIRRSNRKYMRCKKKGYLYIKWYTKSCTIR